MNKTLSLALIFISTILFSITTFAANSEHKTTKKAKISTFEKSLLAAQKNKDYLPAFKLFAKTEFFVLVNADKKAKQGDKINDFSFVIASNPKKPDIPVIVISENIKRLAGIQEGRISAIKITGAELVVSIHPEVSIAIALESGIFEMDKKIIKVLRDSLMKPK